MITNDNCAGCDRYNQKPTKQNCIVNFYMTEICEPLCFIVDNSLQFDEGSLVKTSL